MVTDPTAITQTFKAHLQCRSIFFGFVLFAFLNYSTLVKSQEKKSLGFFFFADNIHARVQPASLKQQNNFT